MRRRISALLAVAALAVTLGSGKEAVASETSKKASSAVVEYVVVTKTANVSGAGTDANVYVQLYGKLGRTGFIELETRSDNFERNSVDAFPLTLEDLGAITWVCLKVDDAGLFPDWTVAYVKVHKGSASWTAPFNGTMPVNTRICRRAS